MFIETYMAVKSGDIGINTQINLHIHIHIHLDPFRFGLLIDFEFLDHLLLMNNWM